MLVLALCRVLRLYKGLDATIRTEIDTKSSRTALMHPHTILYVLK